jgi:Asp/Glu/hydantoin racemase
VDDGDAASKLSEMPPSRQRKRRRRGLCTVAVQRFARAPRTKILFDGSIRLVYHVVYPYQAVETLGFASRAKGDDLSDILVINPNSSQSVTRSMERCLEIISPTTRHAISCVELAKSPPGIETDEHVRIVIPNVLQEIAGSDSDAFVLACFSDPGLTQARAITNKPVVGMAESAYLAALGLGSRFGIISLGQSSIDRHLRYLRELKLDGRLAGDRSIDMTVVELMATDVVETLVRVGRQLRDLDGADVVILGCAGLGSYRPALEAQLGLPVIDPVQAGVALAATNLDLRYRARAR